VTPTDANSNGTIAPLSWIRELATETVPDGPSCAVDLDMSRLNVSPTETTVQGPIISVCILSSSSIFKAIKNQLRLKYKI